MNTIYSHSLAAGMHMASCCCQPPPFPVQASRWHAWATQQPTSMPAQQYPGVCKVCSHPCCRVPCTCHAISCSSWGMQPRGHAVQQDGQALQHTHASQAHKRGCCSCRQPTKCPHGCSHAPSPAQGTAGGLPPSLQQGQHVQQGSQPATAAAPQQTPTRMLVHDYPSPEHPASLKPSPTPTYHSRHPSPPEAVTTSTPAAAGCRSRASTPPAPPSCPAACPRLRPQHRAAVYNRGLTHPQGNCNEGAHAPCCSTPGWVQRRCCGPTGQHLTAHVPAQLLLLSKPCAGWTFGAQSAAGAQPVA